MASRQLLRRSPADAVGVSPDHSSAIVLGVVAAAGLLLVWTWRRRGVDRLVATILALAFVFGMAAQRELGARLQSDGLRYYALLRSLAFDHDVDLTNDYRLLGLDDDRALMTPTVTGYAQSPFSVGPAIAWSPFLLVGHAAAHGLKAAGVAVATDGTSFPYRQAVCIASLFYGLAGLWLCHRLAASFFDCRLAALAALVMGAASFLLWYFVKEPSMSHAVSMCAVAAFLAGWVATRDRRSPVQWAMLGLLAGLAMTVRWQSAVVLVFPAVEWAAAAARARTTRRLGDWRGIVVPGVLFAAGAIVGFLPQMLTWQAIYGAPLAVSPLSPKMLWAHPAITGMLWSSRNGLFATSPITYLGAAGLVLVPRKHRLFGWSAIVVFCAAVYVNACVEDWWAGASYGPRRFDGVIPLLVVGLAAACDALRGLIQKRPMVAVAALLVSLVAWNLTYMAVALTSGFGLSAPRSFGDVSARQATMLHRWMGHPFSYPANLWFSMRNGLSPSRYDILAFEFLSEPDRPYGKVDVGRGDDAYLLDGWYDGEEDPDGTTWRWSAAEAGVLIPLDHAAPLLLQVRAIPFTYDGGPDGSLAATVNGRRFGPVRVSGGGWQRAEIPVEAAAWRPGINRVELLWLSAAIPARVGAGADPRQLGARVDFVRVQVAR